MSDNTVTRTSFRQYSIWRNRSLIFLVALQTVSVMILCHFLGVSFESKTIQIMIMLLKALTVFYLLAYLTWRILYMLIYARPDSLFRWYLKDLRYNVLEPDRIFSGAVALLLISAFTSSFIVAKELIPIINPFSWDPLFSEIDRILHGGQYPWRLLFAAIGTPYVTTVINFFYHMWVTLLYLLMLHACYNVSRSKNHSIYLLASVLVWIIGGNILATVFSSVGPVYYAAFGFGDTYVPLMETLQAFDKISPVMALEIHEMLLNDYLNDGPNRAISAMPSMHVASSVLMAVYGFTLSRWLGWLLTAFATIIMIGSVHLAWHYAIDGYFAAIIVFGCWALARRLVHRFG